MPLHDDFKTPVTTIESQGKPVIDVRGLSFVDISLLINSHRADMEKLFAMYKEFQRKDGGDLVGDALVMRYGFELLNEAPGILANIIALGADETDRVEQISRLPATVQIDSLVAIFKMTIEDFGGVKKMMATLWETALSFAPQEVREKAESAVH